MGKCLYLIEILWYTPLRPHGLFQGEGIDMSYFVTRKTRKGRAVRLIGAVAAIACLGLLYTGGFAEAGVLFSSSWDTATGYSPSAINDGGKWSSTASPTTPLQYPYVSSGGPGGHNFLNMVTVGGGGWGNPYYFSWLINGGNSGDIFRDPANLYIRLYFRVHQSWANNLHNSNHWVVGVDNSANMNGGKHYIRFEGIPGEFTGFNSDYCIGLGVGGSADEVYKAKVSMEVERWYCWEIHVTKIDSSHERWYVRLDGVDITDKFFCTGGSHYGKWLGDLYAQGYSFPDQYHGNLWLCSYDENTVNDGWDLAALEVRDDQWPGPLSGSPGPSPDTTPPSGTIQVTGVEGMAERTGNPAVTLSLSATDSGSGMGSGAQMQFSSNGTTWSSPEPYQNTKAWSLTDVTAGTEQTRTVYVRFKDVAGNWSNPASDSIILDRKPPTPPSAVTISN